MISMGFSTALATAANGGRIFATGRIKFLAISAPFLMPFQKDVKKLPPVG
jgi:hypothetical protein